MNVLFVSLHFRESDTHCRIAQILKEEGVHPYFVSSFRKAGAGVTKQHEKTDTMPDLLEKTRHLVEINNEVMAEMEQKYDLVSLKQVYLADRGLRGIKEVEKTRKLVNYFCAWEDYFDDRQIDCVITDTGGELIRRTAYLVAKRRGIPCIFTIWMPFPKELSLSLDDFYYMENIKDTALNKTLSKEEKASVEEYINKMITAKPFVFNAPLKLSLRRIKKFLAHLWLSIFVEKCSHEHFNKLRHAREFLRRLTNKYISRLLYQKPDYRGKYIFLPLHAADDYQLTLRAPHCADQKYIVDLCSKAIPQGYKLYIKEHPALIGEFSFFTLKKMLKNENVVLVPPTISSHLLVEKAQAVIVINSTVGFEGLLHFKPVITFAYCFYRGHGLTIDVDNFFDLPRAIKRASDFQVDKEKLYSFLYAVMNSGYEGCCVGNISDENIKKTALSILDKLHRCVSSGAVLAEQKTN